MYCETGQQFFQDKCPLRIRPVRPSAKTAENELSIGAYSGIEYEKSLSSDFAMFRQRIARGTNGGFTLYSKTGSVDLESADILAAPRLEAGEKYAVLYDAGAKRYSVFTSLAKVLSAESEKEIEDCAVSDSGRYALLTRSDEARYLITVYSSDFKSLTEYYMDRFVVDMALDEKGETIAVASVDICFVNISAGTVLTDFGNNAGSSISFQRSFAGNTHLLQCLKNGRIFTGKRNITKNNCLAVDIARIHLNRNFRADRLGGIAAGKRCGEHDCKEQKSNLTKGFHG